MTSATDPYTDDTPPPDDTAVPIPAPEPNHSQPAAPDHGSDAAHSNQPGTPDEPDAPKGLPVGHLIAGGASAVAVSGAALYQVAGMWGLAGAGMATAAACSAMAYLRLRRRRGRGERPAHSADRERRGSRGRRPRGEALFGHGGDRTGKRGSRGTGDTHGKGRTGTAHPMSPPRPFGRPTADPSSTGRRRADRDLDGNGRRSHAGRRGTRAGTRRAADGTGRTGKNNRKTAKRARKAARGARKLPRRITKATGRAAKRTGRVLHKGARSAGRTAKTAGRGVRRAGRATGGAFRRLRAWADRRTGRRLSTVWATVRKSRGFQRIGGAARRVWSRWLARPTAAATAALTAWLRRWRRRPEAAPDPEQTDPREEPTETDDVPKTDADTDDTSTGEPAGDKTDPAPLIPIPADPRTRFRRTHAMTAFPLTQVAAEMNAAAAAHAPADMFQVARELDQMAEVPAYVALSIRTYTERLRSEYPIDPVVVDAIYQLYQAQALLTSLAEEIGPLFRKVHADDLRREEAPRTNEPLWNV
ncbi:hypothetical protein [Sinosporangium siamense]|uniref:Uncharacterized protein n=1 Tax=Sinosporangium siamense TaxID=1367973 RepID=A0A919REX2_9ACTN|nr:hypothetical protein [Sinosporangium siamense]GII91154.1 hypothetical protein Ssi02_13850 [Sinosporangium siamense]